MFPKEVYIERRKKLKTIVKSGIAVFLGNNEAPMNYPANTYPFRQDSNFLYFFQLDHPGFAGIIDIDNDKDIVFGNDVDIDDIIWMGPQPSVAEQALACGVNTTRPFADIFDYLESERLKGRKIHFLPPYRAENKILLEKITGIHSTEVNKHASADLIKAVVSLRSIKDQYEIKHLDDIMDIAYELHTSAMKMAVPGLFEREIHGRIEGIAMSHGGRVSFPVILTRRGETLHNHYHGNQLQKGDLLLIDAGFESPYRYATDHTRSIPVGGTFTTKQKEIYQTVLDANNAATASIKPGITYKSVHMIAASVIARNLTDIGLMKGDPAEAVAAGAHTLFFPHGLGHMMGLDVHDMEDIGETYVGYDEEVTRSTEFGTAYLRLGRKLQPGFVITNEPGVYFIPALIDNWQKDNLHSDFINYNKVREYIGFGGIRLEDDILVTETGCRNMGKRRIPIEIHELESIVGKGL